MQIQTKQKNKSKQLKMSKAIETFSIDDIENIIKEGEEEIKNGKSFEAREVFKEMRKKYGY